MRLNDKILSRKGKNRITLINNHKIYNIEGDEYLVFQLILVHNNVDEVINEIIGKKIFPYSKEILVKNIYEFYNSLLEKGIILP